MNCRPSGERIAFVRAFGKRRRHIKSHIKAAAITPTPTPAPNPSATMNQPVISSLLGLDHQPRAEDLTETHLPLGGDAAVLLETRADTGLPLVRSERMLLGALDPA